jgi:hypothetical protein
MRIVHLFSGNFVSGDRGKKSGSCEFKEDDGPGPTDWS